MSKCEICGHDICGCIRSVPAQDVTASKEWNEGCDFAMTQLCKFLDVEPGSVSWDAATETLDGDVNAVIWNILRAKMGDDWGPDDVLAQGSASYEKCPSCGGAGLALNDHGEPDECRECGGDTVVPAQGQPFGWVSRVRGDGEHTYRFFKERPNDGGGIYEVHPVHLGVVPAEGGDSSVSDFLNAVYDAIGDLETDSEGNVRWAALANIQREVGQKVHEYASRRSPAASANEPLPMADHDEIGRKVLNQPWSIQSAIVTIAAHCAVIRDECPAGTVADLAACISSQLADLAEALAGRSQPDNVSEDDLRHWLSEQPYKASDLAKRLLSKFNVVRK